MESQRKSMMAAQEWVRRLYEAVSRGGGMCGGGDVEVEWWFHGPQKCHYMMKKLTGKSTARDFEFEPRNMEVVEEHVIVEGWEGSEVYWVHVWTMKDGAITQFREYFNTCLTVTDLRCSSAAPLWQSHHPQLQQRSLPSLMLAI